jgi:hypothetical protein
MAEPSKVDVNTPGDVGGSTYEALETARRPCRHLMGGTSTVRANVGTYLPMLPEEAGPEYQERYMGAVVKPWYPDAVDDLVGKPFSGEIRLESDVPLAIRGQKATDNVPAVRGWAENADMAKADFQTFLSRVFHEAVAEGGGAVLIEHPPTDLPTNPSKADNKASQKRPYLVHLHPEQIIEASTATVDGNEVLEVLRYRSSRKGAKTQLGGCRPVIPQVWVLHRGKPDVEGGWVRWELYEPNAKGNWSEAPIEKGTREPFTEIPVEPAIEWDLLPPLRNLADLVFEDWRAEIGMAGHITTGLRMTVGTYGFDTDKVIAAFRYSAGLRILSTPKGPNDAKMEILESSGAVVAAWQGERDKRHEAIRLASKRPEMPEKTQTLGEKRIDTAGANAALRRMVDRFKDRMESILRLWAEAGAWALEANETPGGTITFPDDYLKEGANPAVLQDLQAMRNRPEGPDISRLTAWERRAALGALPPDFDYKQELARLAEEAKEDDPGLLRTARELLDTPKPPRAGEPKPETEPPAAN